MIDNDNWQDTPTPCAKCGARGGHSYRVVTSDDGGHADEQHECRACGKTWWVDSSDA